MQTSGRFIEPGHDLENGILTIPVHGVDLRITGPDRTVLDLLRYSRQVSAEHGLEALRQRARASDFRVPAFARLARHLGTWKRVEPLVQGLMLR
ncbi:hypothetical protein [Nannocystis pusilla]|uniref:hypothetical protein n=1 Tax=Nannocystis pusilla TaxID=889268 RepID=UPI003B7C1AA9